MRNLNKITELIRLVDDLKDATAAPRLAATSDPDYETVIQLIEKRLVILSEHLEFVEMELIDALAPNYKTEEGRGDSL